MGYRLGFSYGKVISESKFDDVGARTEGSFRGRNLVVTELFESVEKHVVGPWIRPAHDVFQSGDSEIERKIACESDSVRSFGPAALWIAHQMLTRLPRESA